MDMNKKINEESTRAIIGKTHIVVVNGDITTQKVDVIVNSANTWMSLGGSRSVAGAIVKKTLGKVQDDLHKIKLPIDLGDIAVTKGYDLPCKYIFHLATHGSKNEESSISQDDMVVRLHVISKGIMKIIDAANKLDANTLAMPIFATGSLGYPKRIITEAILNGLQKGLSNNSTLKQIRLVVYQNDRAFEKLANAVRYKLIDPVETSLPKIDSAGLEKQSSTFISALSNRYADEKHSVEQSDLDVQTYFLKRNLQLDYCSDVSHLSANYVTVHKDTFNNFEKEIFNLREQVRILREEKSQMEKSLSSTFQFPLPIAFAVSMGASENIPSLRAENLRKAFSIFLRYLAVLGIAEYASAGAFSNDLNAKLVQIFRSPITDGAWLKIIEEISQSFSDEPKANILKEYPQLFIKGKKKSHLGGLLRGLLELRNEIHESYIVDDSSFMRWLERAQPMWQDAIEDAKPVFDYQLFFLEDLIDFGDDDPSVNKYQVRWLMGEFFVPRGEIVEWRTRLKKGRLYLKHPNNESFLQLYPFMIYEHCKITNAREASCIEKVMQESVSFATFRFPYHWKENSCPQEIRRLLGDNQQGP
jgi:O-acetyl-ADP-ribose deacetylase